MVLIDFIAGLACVVPVEMFPLFSPGELEDLVCGKSEVDIELLQQVAEYEEPGVDENTPHIRYLWEVLHEMQPDERTAFLRFVWARSRMPQSACNFPTSFKIQGAQNQEAKSSPDDYLPRAQTCFFSLSLPAYTSKQILHKKLLLAINNTPSMDADVRLHNAEGWGDV